MQWWRWRESNPRPKTFPSNSFRVFPKCLSGLGHPRKFYQTHKPRWFLIVFPTTLSITSFASCESKTLYLLFVIGVGPSQATIRQLEHNQHQRLSFGLLLPGLETNLDTPIKILNPCRNQYTPNWNNILVVFNLCRGFIQGINNWMGKMGCWVGLFLGNETKTNGRYVSFDGFAAVIWVEEVFERLLRRRTPRSGSLLGEF